jgi:cation diffusion facilitator family transporter
MATTFARLKYPLLFSLLAALLTMAMKWTAYFLTGSVGIFSDAAESVLNLVAASAALFSLWYASRPVDPTHTYGHEKIEYFSGGLVGGMILVASAGIAWHAFHHLLELGGPESLELGIPLTLATSLINSLVALWLVKMAQRCDSLILEAEGRHLFSDVWTSVAVVAGLVLYWFTKLAWLDATLGLLVAIYIAWTGFHLVRVSFDGLMDHALPEQEQEAVRAAIASQLKAGMDFHALRTRKAGARRFVDFHLLVPGRLSVRRAHELTAGVEGAVRAALPGIEVTVHIEPIEDQAAWDDSELVPLEQAARRAQQEGSGEKLGGTP